MVQRLTPMDEIERINERLLQEARLKIQDRDSFDLAFNDVLNLREAELSQKQKKLRNDAFDLYKGDNPEVSEERLFTKARGKDLARDRKQTAKRVVTTQREFEKQTAPEVDLKGFDTARQKFDREIAVRRTFTVPARIKNKIVFAKSTSVVVKGKRQARLRDARGMFASARAK